MIITIADTNLNLFINKLSMRRIKIAAIVMFTLPLFFSCKKDKDTAPAFSTIGYVDPYHLLKF